MATTFARTILSAPLSIGDADVSPPEQMVKSLSLGTGVDEAIIRNLGIRSSQEFLGTVDASQVRPWVLPLRSGPRKRWRKALQICPVCLGEKGYFRRLWRLAFMTCCPVHNVYLLDQCSCCESRIRIWQFGFRSLGRTLDIALLCHRCQQPFSQCPLESATREVIAAQEVLIGACVSGSAMGIGLLKFDAANGFAFLRRSIADGARRNARGIEFQSLAMRRIALAPWNTLLASPPGL